MTASLGAVVLALSCLVPAASASSEDGPRRRGFEDQVRCRFILDEVCARLQAGDRPGASAFVIQSPLGDFASLPLDQGAILSCRRVKTFRLMSAKRKAPLASLLLSYGSKSTQEVALSFDSLGPWTCGFISEVQIGPRRFMKDGKAFLDFSIQWDGSEDGGDDALAGRRPEEDDSPRSAYVEKVLKGIRAERERREAEKDPLARPLIQKE